MLSESAYQEAVRRYKNMRVNGHERQRYHALILVHQGYSYREVAQILLVDEETISRWVQQYQERGLAGLENEPQWGGEHGQRELSAEQVDTLKRILREGAMPGTLVGSGWTNKAVRQLLAERFGVPYSKSGVRNGKPVVPLASDQSKVYLEGTLGRRWNPIGQQPLVADGARQKRAENLYGAVHLGTGAEVAPFALDWQDSDATIRWYELLLEECPHGQLLLWQDQAPHHTSEEVEEWLETQPRIEVIAFPKYTPEENPKEATWKDLKEEVSHHHWHETLAELRTAIDGYYQAGKKHVVTFLEKFGYRWVDGVIQPLPQTV